MTDLGIAPQPNGAASPRGQWHPMTGPWEVSEDWLPHLDMTQL